MNTVTHALIPVVAICVYRRLKPTAISLTKWQLFFIGLSGAAPDVINPHLSLQSRYESWSHSLISWVGFSILLAVLVFAIPKRFSAIAAILMSLAYLLHLLCDAVSGGIAWLQPFSDSVIGAYYVSPALWIPMDIVLILTAYILFRIPSLTAKNQLG